VNETNGVFLLRCQESGKNANKESEKGDCS